MRFTPPSISCLLSTCVFTPRTNTQAIAGSTLPEELGSLIAVHPEVDLYQSPVGGLYGDLKRWDLSIGVTAYCEPTEKPAMCRSKAAGNVMKLGLGELIHVN